MFSENYLQGVVTGVISTAIVSGICYAGKKIYKKFKNKGISSFLGCSDKEISLVYPTFVTIYGNDFCFIHSSKESTKNQKKYRVSPAVSQAEVRSMGYITPFLKEFGLSNIMISDTHLEEMNSENAISRDVISFGLGCDESISNIKNNPFFELYGYDISCTDFPIQCSEGKYIEIQHRSDKIFPIDNIPYGFILRRKNQSTQKTQITCAGFNEWGTSGAAYCLSNQYDTIIKKLKKELQCWRTPDIDFFVVVQGHLNDDSKSKILQIWIMKADCASDIHPIRIHGQEISYPDKKGNVQSVTPDPEMLCSGKLSG